MNLEEFEEDQPDEPEHEDSTHDDQITDPIDESEPDEEISDITIGDPVPIDEDEEKIKSSSAWVRLRKEKKEAETHARELEARLSQLQSPVEQSRPILEKPTLAGCEWDPDMYEQALLNWSEIQLEQRQVQAQARQKEQAQQQEWNNTLAAYNDAKAKIPLKDFEDSEDEVAKNLNVNQQGLVIKYARDPAKLIYALGKNKTKLDELKAINDPIRFAIELNNIEVQMKVQTRKPPPPETKISAGTGRMESTDAHLEKLRAHAEKTGNFTDVVAYKRKLSAK